MSDQIGEPLAALRTDLHAAGPALAALDPSHLDRAATWREHPSTGRFLLYRLAEEAFDVLTRLRTTLAVEGFVQSDAQSILGAAGEARGRFLGVLYGLTQDQFDAEPGPDDWSPRRIAGHVAAADRNFPAQVNYAVSRVNEKKDVPLRPDPETLPAMEGSAESQGSMDDVLGRLDQGRSDAVATIRHLDGSDLSAESAWLEWDVDVRFRLLRFAGHDRDHLFHLKKTLAALGIEPNDGRLVVEETSALWGAVEGAMVGLHERMPASAAVGPLLDDAVAEQRRLLAEIAG